MNHINWCTRLTPEMQSLFRAQIVEIYKMNARFPRNTPMHTAWVARVERMLAAQETKS